MPTIDADAHVLETPETWRYLRDEEKAHAPMVVTGASGAQDRGPEDRAVKEYWAVDGALLPKEDNVGSDTAVETREMRDIPARLAHMDRLDVDIQVLYPTLFLRPITMKADVELALSRSYNRWLAGIWRQAPERLRWVMSPPLLAMDRLDEELDFAQDNGAVGIFMRGLECDRTLNDPWLFPVYEAAQRRNLPICIHSATNSPTMHRFFIDDSGFSKFKLATIGAFHTLVYHGIPDRFPGVRWGFIEVSSQWVPYVLNDLSIRFRRQGRTLGDDVLRRNNIWVACQVTDDLPYVLGYTGEEHLVIGTDYGHADTATEIEALRLLKKDGRVEPRVIDRILDDNARALYGLG